jgi:two-component system, OmpR family, sensor kinase
VRRRFSERWARRSVGAESVLVRRAARRLGLQAAAFVAVAVVLVTAAATVVLLRDQEQAVTNLQDATIALADDVGDPPLDTWLVIRDPRGQQDSTRGLPPGADDPAVFAAVVAGAPPLTTDRRVRGVTYRVTTVRRADGFVVQAVLDLTPRHHDRIRILAAMHTAGAAGLLLAAAAGTWLGRRALQPLSAALALQRRFVADAGHELRTPLTLLGTRAQLLRRRLQHVRAGDPPPAWSAADPLTVEALTDRALADVGGIVADSTQLAAILDDLLLAADPLATRPQQVVDLVPLCRDTVRAAAPLAQERGVALRGPAATDGPVEVVGSAVALRRAVTALVDNALRHASSSVSVVAERERDHAVVAVTDDGPGVDRDLVPRLFDRFATGAPTHGRGPRRYGLGLALVAEIAAAHHGDVTLDAPPGTTLRITLPAAPRDPSPGRTPRNL